MRPQHLALPSRQTFLHHSCRRIKPQSGFRVAHLSTTVVLDPVLQRITNFHRPVNSAVRPELAEVVHPPSISSLHSTCACTLCLFRDGREAVSEMFNSAQP